MGNYEVELFNQLILKQSVKESYQQIQRLFQRHQLMLSEREAADMIANRTAILQQYRLIDFSFHMLEEMTVLVLANGCQSKQEAIAQINGVQELFYYLRGLDNDSFADDELLEYLSKLYNRCDGHLDFLTSYVEDHSDLASTYEGGDWFEGVTE